MVSFILPGNSASSDYEVANSLRFDGASSAYLSKTFGSSGNRKTFTVSFWVKKCELAANPDTMADAQMLFGGQQSGYPAFNIIFLHTNDTIFLKDAQNTNDIQISIKSDLKFRDPSAWYHVVFAIDTTQSTASNRAKLYINGVQQTDLAGENATGGASDDPLYPDQNQDLQFNGNEAHYINKYSTNYEDMYMAEFVFVDGQQLNATSFGEFDSDSGIWKPIDVSGLTFGTNGFYLDFEDSSSLGNDAAGSNNWTTNNIAATDQSTDTCTNNFATFNPLIPESSSVTFGEGNLKMTTTGTDSWTTHYGVSSIAVSSGKWYVESKVTTTTTSQAILGIVSTSQAINSSLKDVGRATVETSGRITVFGSNAQTGLTAFSNGDIAAIAFDADNGTAQFYRNGSTYGSAVSSIASAEYYFATTTYDGSGGVVEFNFGSPAFSISSGNSDANGYGNFEYSVPSGYYALNTKNLAEYG